MLAILIFLVPAIAAGMIAGNAFAIGLTTPAIVLSVISLGFFTLAAFVPKLSSEGKYRKD